MSFSRWVDKCAVQHPENAISFNAKEEWAIQPWQDREEKSMYVTKCKKPTWKAWELKPEVQILKFSEGLFQRGKAGSQDVY